MRRVQQDLSVETCNFYETETSTFRNKQLLNIKLNQARVR